MHDRKEFLVACDKAEGEERAEYCIISVDVGLLVSRQAALVAAMASDGGVSHIAYSTGFRLECYNSRLKITGDHEDGQCLFESSVQDEFDGERVAELPEGTQAHVLEDDESNDECHDETSPDDDRLIVHELGVMVYTTLDDGATPVRSWTVTWDRLGLPFPKKQ